VKKLDLKQFLTAQSYGCLSTYSVLEPDYPFGSLTPYIVDDDGNPIIHISELAEHTQNIIQNPRVSLTVFDIKDTVNPTSSPRICCLADAIKLPTDTALKQRYLNKYPDSEIQLSLPGFEFYKLELKRIRFIAGFGKMGWVNVSELD